MPRNNRCNLTPNVPQQIALKSDGLPSTNGEQVRFELLDGRHLLLDLETAQRLAELEINLEEPFWICHKWSGSPEEAPYIDLWLDPATERRLAREEAPELERQLRESLDWAKTRNAPKFTGRKGPKATRVSVTPASAVSSSPELLDFETMLVSQTNTLTDAFAKVLEHAKAYPAIQREDLRSIFVSVFINVSPRGYRRNAA